YWPTIQPFFTLLSLYIAACVLTYEFLQSQYALVPQIGATKLPMLDLFLHSYVFKQISLVAAAVGMVGLLLRIFNPKPHWGKKMQWLPAGRRYRVLIAVRVAVVLAVLCGVVPVFRSFTPRDVGDIRVLFLQDPYPEYDQSALVYLLYELNARQ